MVIDILNKFLTKHTNYKLEKIQPEIEEKVEKKESNKKNSIDIRNINLEDFSIIYSNLNSNIEAFGYSDDYILPSGNRKRIIIKRKNSKWENIYFELHSDCFNGDDGLREVDDFIETKVLTEKEISEVKHIICGDEKALMIFETYICNMDNPYNHSYVDYSSFTSLFDNNSRLI